MPFKDYSIMECEDIIEGEYCMLETIDMALGHRMEPPNFDLNAALRLLDVDERLSTYYENGICSTSCSIC
jgi:hypothetical protein